MPVNRTCLRCERAFTAPPSDTKKYCCRACQWGPADERFWRRVERVPAGCWRWTGGMVSRHCPYGRLQWDGRMRLAHHVAWLLVRGPIPAGQWVRHRCPGGGNPWCVNPDHLQLGTARENALDTLADGRHWSQTGVWSPSKRGRPDGVLGEMRELVVILPRTLHRRLTTRARAEGRSLQELALAALAAF